MEEALPALTTGAQGLQVVQAPVMLGYGGLRKITPMTARIA